MLPMLIYRLAKEAELAVTPVGLLSPADQLEGEHVAGSGHHSPTSLIDEASDPTLVQLDLDVFPLVGTLQADSFACIYKVIDGRRKRVIRYEFPVTPDALPYMSYHRSPFLISYGLLLDS
jgi:hypothetical protein